MHKPCVPTIFKIANGVSALETSSHGLDDTVLKSPTRSLDESKRAAV